MLHRVGIESDVVGSGSHAFLKVKDIELPLTNGNMVKGDTIVDPTWNLTTHRYGGRPSHFCISYEQARQSDVDDEGKDHQSHKNDEELQDATLSLDDQSLRKLYTSVGLADEKGQFPIKGLIEKSKLIDETYASESSKNIETQFLLLAKTCPEFATCQNSSMSILKDILLSNGNIQFNRCVVNRVYTRTDKRKRPVMYVFIDSDEIGKKFYVANKEQGRFIGLSQEEFIKQFECYETDLEKNKRNKTMGN